MSPAINSSPPVDIPRSSSTVHVHIINTTSRVKNIPFSVFVEPPIKGLDYLDCPAFSFLIQHPTNGRKLLFDLGIRKDWKNLAPRITDRIRGGCWQITVEKDVAEILQEGGVKLGDIDAIIWSHFHWDHTGDPSTFPTSTELVVGPGFKKAFMPGYPSNPDAPIKESDYRGRNVREISFANSSLRLGRFRALDYFGDGSFYLLDAPGHAIGHLCALCRTTTSPDTFIFLGGDCSHHGGEFRPTQSLPLPKDISPSPLPSTRPNICPGSLFTPIHRLYNQALAAEQSPAMTQPFLLPSANAAHDVKDAKESIDKMEELDARDDVLTCIAHDDTLLGVVGLFPDTTANAWREKGWREKALWRFLGDYEEAVKETIEAT